jgi:hypothetical protein
MARKLPVYPSDSASLQFSGLGCFVLVSLLALRGFAFAQVTDSLGGQFSIASNLPVVAGRMAARRVSGERLWQTQFPQRLLSG